MTSPWGYCDKCSAALDIGDACWVEHGCGMDEALTFCCPCWESSRLCRQQRHSEHKARNVLLAGHRGPTAIVARFATITEND